MDNERKHLIKFCRPAVRMDNEVYEAETSYRIMSTRLHAGTAILEADCEAVIRVEYDMVYNQYIKSCFSTFFIINIWNPC